MAIEKYTLDKNEKLTEKQLQMIQEAAARPAAFDEDSPELTEEQLANFRRLYEHNQKKRPPAECHPAAQTTKRS